MPSSLELMMTMPDEPEQRLPQRPIFSPLEHLASDPSAQRPRELVERMRQGDEGAHRELFTPDSLANGDSLGDVVAARNEFGEWMPFNLVQNSPTVRRLRNGGMHLVMQRNPLDESNEIGNRFVVGFRDRALGGEDGRPTTERRIELGSLQIIDDFAEDFVLHPSQDGGYTRVLEIPKPVVDVVRYPHEIFVAR